MVYSGVKPIALLRIRTGEIRNLLSKRNTPAMLEDYDSMNEYLTGIRIVETYVNSAGFDLVNTLTSSTLTKPVCLVLIASSKAPPYEGSRNLSVQSSSGEPEETHWRICSWTVKTKVAPGTGSHHFWIQNGVRNALWRRLRVCTYRISPNFSKLWIYNPFMRPCA